MRMKCKLGVIIILQQIPQARRLKQKSMQTRGFQFPLLQIPAISSSIQLQAGGQQRTVICCWMHRRRWLSEFDSLSHLSDMFSSILNSGEQLKIKFAFPRSGWNVNSEGSSCCFNLWGQPNIDERFRQINSSMSTGVSTCFIRQNPFNHFQPYRSLQNLINLDACPADHCSWGQTTQNCIQSSEWRFWSSSVKSINL